LTEYGAEENKLNVLISRWLWNWSRHAIFQYIL